MANRVLMGQYPGSGSQPLGFFVSKAASNVLTCAKKDLLFDSSQKRAGEVYAGGSLSSLTTVQSYLTTGSKDSLGYIPLVLWTEDKKGEREVSPAFGAEYWTDRLDVIETTIYGVEDARANIGSVNAEYVSNSNMSTGRYGGISDCTNIKFMVLKIPCAYGYMTSAYFD
tara:strand:+ start:282 stop:788 length:507 start_codon:yes stop_codon:yes gene_type:complete